MRSKNILLKLSLLSLLMTVSAFAEEPKEATKATADVNNQVLKDLPFSDTQDFEDAKKGFVDTLPTLIIKNSNGQDIWDMESYKYQNDKPAPATVNPSLWRIAQVNNINGLFKVTDRVIR